MTREWKPGDVAVLRFESIGYGAAVGVRRAENDGWYHSGGFGGGSAYDSIVGYVARPLVVIDPGDREQVERLRDLTLDALDEQIGYQVGNDEASTKADLGNAMQAALREFANPTPAKPDEPTGNLAVIEDADGNRWVNWRDPRQTHSHERPWVLVSDPATSFNYGDITAVRVLSDGVQP